MGLLTSAELDALTRIDFQIFLERMFVELNPGIPYLDNFHIPMVAAKLEAVRQGDITRLILTVPPRSLKSFITSVAYIAWCLGHDPTLKILAASYAQDLAEDLSRDCRAIMQSELYRRLFPATRLNPSRLAANAFETTAGGCRRAAAGGGRLIGVWAELIVIHDALKTRQEVFRA